MFKRNTNTAQAKKNPTNSRELQFKNICNTVTSWVPGFARVMIRACIFEKVCVRERKREKEKDIYIYIYIYIYRYRNRYIL